MGLIDEKMTESLLPNRTVGAIALVNKEPKTTSKTRYRRFLIKEKVRAGMLTNISEINEMLTGDGYAASPSVISNDLRSLGICKVEGFYQLPEGDLPESATPCPTI
jgi:hypothetical protein